MFKVYLSLENENYWLVSSFLSEVWLLFCDFCLDILFSMNFILMNTHAYFVLAFWKIYYEIYSDIPGFFA